MMVWFHYLGILAGNLGFNLVVTIKLPRNRCIKQRPVISQATFGVKPSNVKHVQVNTIGYYIKYKTNITYTLYTSDPANERFLFL